MTTQSSESTLPWATGPAILPTLRAWTGRDPCPLPDEPPALGSKLRFAPGAWDGIATHHLGAAGEHDEARHVLTTVAALARLCRESTDAARVAVYRLYLEQTVSPHADAILEELRRQDEFGPDHLRPHARWLVRHAAHREPLKLGVLLTGACGAEGDITDLAELARHDEFTLFAAVAAGNLVGDPVDVWWDMARRVHGWGKVQLVERLARRADDRPDLRAWLLRHGCDNDVMPDYLAHSCAVGGRLIEALSEDAVDDELLDGACLIVGTLLNCGGPAADIDGYPDGVLAVRSLVGQLEGRCGTLARLETVRRVRDWLNEPAAPDRDVWAERAERGWAEGVRADLLAACGDILARPGWAEVVRAAYRSGDAAEEHRAWYMAGAVGVDLWEPTLAKLHAAPLESGLYWRLLRTDDPARLARVVAFAEANLPLVEIATGPADELGLGPAYAAHGCLDFVLQEMTRDGVYSAALVAAGLRSPVVRNRNMALKALESRPVGEWGEEVVRAVERAVAEEPCDNVRKRLAVLAAKISERN